MLVRIQSATPLSSRRLRLDLTDGTTVERDVAALLTGPMFETIRSDSDAFARVRAVDGALRWPNGAELCADAVLWNGLPPADEAERKVTPAA